MDPTLTLTLTLTLTRTLTLTKAGFKAPRRAYSLTESNESSYHNKAVQVVRGFRYY